MIPLFEPFIDPSDWDYVKKCLESGWVSSAGPDITEFENRIADFTRVDYAVATVNGTAALHLALLGAGVVETDLVICPTLTFIATANAVKYIGASPVLVDADEDSWQMNSRLVEKWLTEETVHNNGKWIHRTMNRRIGAIVLTHVLGGMGDMDEWLRISERWKIPVIEDAAEALGSTYKGRFAGSFGRAGILSFNGNKIITTGGGGMILTSDRGLAQKVRHLSTQAKASAKEYIHDEPGFNYRMPNLNAALGLAQFAKLGEFLRKKRAAACMYQERLAGYSGLIGFQHHHVASDSNQWLFTIRTKEKDALLQRLEENDVQARALWKPVHLQTPYHKEIYITERDMAGKLYNSCVSLPGSVNLTEEQIARICNIINHHKN